MEVLGRDSAREAYRIGHGGAVALLPDHVIAAGLRLTGGHGHRTAYDWIARNDRALRDAIDTLKAGGRPPAPFDRMDLLEETECPPKS